VSTRILIVSYLFPPVGGVGVQRALSFAKYLPQCGFEVHVLRARNAAAPLSDPGLLREIPAAVRVHNAFTPELPFHFRKKVWALLSRPGGTARAASPGSGPPVSGSVRSLLSGAIRRMLTPDPEVLWVPFATRQARRIILRYAIDVVLVTAPPFSAFLVGNTLKQEFPNLKLFADFRDDWLRFVLADFGFQKSRHAVRRAEEIERATVALADRVLFVTRAILRNFRERYPREPEEKFAYLPNGYDPESYRDCRRETRNDGKIVVAYVGSVYKATSPDAYLDAVDEMPDEVRSRIETRFIGRIAEEEQGLFRARKAVVTLMGFLPHQEALRQMQGADYLLLTVNNDFALSGKVFEYLAAGRPILAVSPRDGEVANLVEETSAGWCADPSDKAGIQSMLSEACRRVREGGQEFAPDWPVIRRYERPRLAAELGQLIAAARGMSQKA
jgi:glycosyltransferase involved in cell wall biosynthesis